MLKYFEENLKCICASSVSCNFNGSYVLEPKFGKIVFNFPEDINLVKIHFKRLSGNGKILINNNQETIFSKNIEIKNVIDFLDNICISRPLDSIGEIAIIGIEVHLEEEEEDKLKNWKSIVKSFQNYKGLSLVNNNLLAFEGAFIEPQEMVKDLVTEPANVFSRKDNKLIFNYSCKIVSIEIDKNTAATQGKDLFQTRELPFPLNENIENKTNFIESNQILINQEKILQDKKTDLSTIKIIYDSDPVKGLSQFYHRNNKSLKFINTNNKHHIVLKPKTNISIPISGLELNKKYILIVNGKKVNGNGKVRASLSSSLDSSSPLVIFNGLNEELNFQLECTNLNDLKINVGMLDDSIGEVIISRLLLIEGLNFENNRLFLGSSNYISSINKDNNKNILINNSNNFYSLKKKFVIAIPSYKNQQWAEKNILSALNQNYSNFRILFTDDCSPDETFNIVSKAVENHHNKYRVTLYKNETRKGALENLYNMIHSCDDDEIIITLDGDDWFPNEEVLNKLNEVYQNENVWMTYGQYKASNGPEIGCSREIPKRVIESSNYRSHPWCTSHLRTFYSWLFKRIDKQDLLYEGNFLTMAWDVAFMLPLLEMSGGKFKFISDVLYIYNVENPINDWKVNQQLQVKLEKFIRSKRKYNIINESPIKNNKNQNFVTFKELGRYGRVGNQLFQVAACINLAAENNANVKLNWYCNYTKKDMSLFFKNKISSNINYSKIEYYYADPSNSYTKIPYKNNMNLHGYFQSELYFKNNESLIRFYFEPSDDIKNKLYDKYSKVLESNTCSLHIRRGDYVNNKVHGVCDLNYYNNAIEKIKSMTSIDNFLIFSDDINWCKSHFSKNYTFIENNLDIEDIFLMSYCKHNIISNSSFSWWGSWLNANPNKIILAPSQWFVTSSGISNNDIYTKEMLKL